MFLAATNCQVCYSRGEGGGYNPSSRRDNKSVGYRSLAACTVFKFWINLNYAPGWLPFSFPQTPLRSDAVSPPALPRLRLGGRQPLHHTHAQKSKSTSKCQIPNESRYECSRGFVIIVPMCLRMSFRGGASVPRKGVLGPILCRT